MAMAPKQPIKPVAEIEILPTIKFTADIEVLPVSKKFKDLEIDEYFTIPCLYGEPGINTGIPVWRKVEFTERSGMGGAHLLDGREKQFNPDDDVLLVLICNIRKAKK